MDKEILEQYASVVREISDCEKRIQESKDRLSVMEEIGYTECDTVKGGFGGNQRYHVEGIPYKRYQKEKTALQTRILRLERLKDKIIELRNMVEEYIANTEDSRMRRMLTYRYVDRMSWRQVAFKMGAGYTEDSCRKEMERFLKKCG